MKTPAANFPGRRHNNSDRLGTMRADRGYPTEISHIPLYGKVFPREFCHSGTIALVTEAGRAKQTLMRRFTQRLGSWSSGMARWLVTAGSPTQLALNRPSDRFCRQRLSLPQNPI
ncbi:hypothetical protein KL909_004604 [Ogataea angusta]|nr:hypothetical protein KL909_004604 [Ogataea angusta]